MRSSQLALSDAAESAWVRNDDCFSNSLQLALIWKGPRYVKLTFLEYFSLFEYFSVSFCATGKSGTAVWIQLDFLCKNSTVRATPLQLKLGVFLFIVRAKHQNSSIKWNEMALLVTTAGLLVSLVTSPYIQHLLTQQAALRLWHSLPVPLSSCDFALNVFMERGASDLLFCESEQRQYGMSTPTHKQRVSIWVKQTPSFYNRGAWSRHFFCGSQNPDWCLRRRSQEQATTAWLGCKSRRARRRRRWRRVDESEYLRWF